jgi:transposase
MNEQDWLKYWKRFGLAALVNASIFTAYRLYMAHLKKEHEKEVQKKDSEKSSTPPPTKENKPPRNYSRDKELWMDKARTEKTESAEKKKAPAKKRASRKKKTDNNE